MCARFIAMALNFDLKMNGPRIYISSMCVGPYAFGEARPNEYYAHQNHPPYVCMYRPERLLVRICTMYESLVIWKSFPTYFTRKLLFFIFHLAATFRYMNQT